MRRVDGLAFEDGATRQWQKEQEAGVDPDDNSETGRRYGRP